MMAAKTDMKPMNGDVHHTKSAHVDEFESHCGMGTCRPKGLQRCNNVLSFVICYGVSSLVTQTLNAYIISQITAIEKQFKLDSTTTGLILSCNDIGFLCTVLFIGHFGKYYHIPRILSAASFLFGVAGILSSMCYFMDPYYLPKLAGDDIQNSTENDEFVAPLCSRENTTSSDSCHEGRHMDEPGSSKWPILILSIGMVFQGVGKSPRSSLAIAYIDNNNAVKTKTGMYLGISMTMLMMGPALAIILGGLFRRIPVDLQDTLLTPTHPEWLGAWWLGFLVFGCLGLVIGIPLLFFPKNIISPAEESTSNRLHVTEKLKDLPRSLIRVLKNPVYTLVLIGLLCLIFMFAGSLTFSSKYVEKQFMIPGFKTNIILGIQSVIGASIGTLAGGYLTTRLKLTRLGCIKLVMIALAISLGCSSFELFLGCETPEIKGFQDESSVAACVCEPTDYFPVCGDGKDTYFSPCYAGCTNQSHSVYGGCSEVSSGQAVAGMCESDCPYLYYYLAVDLLQKLVGTMSIMPIYVIELRSVAEKDKAIAFALMSFLGSLLGFMPAPIVFGYIIDKTCLIWEQSCGVSGACGQYELRDLRYLLKSVELSGKVTCFIFFIAAMFVLKSKGKEESPSGLQLALNVNTKKSVEGCKMAEKTESSQL